MDHYIERVVDLTEPDANHIYNFTVEEARQHLLTGQPDAVRGIQGSFALVAHEGKTVRMARSLPPWPTARTCRWSCAGWRVRDRLPRSATAPESLCCDVRP